jgi:hypothetical protein
LSNLIVESLEQNKLNYFSKKSNARSRRLIWDVRRRRTRND